MTPLAPVHLSLLDVVLGYLWFAVAVGWIPVALVVFGIDPRAVVGGSLIVGFVVLCLLAGAR